MICMNDAYGWLNDLGLTFIVVIVWNRKIFTWLSMGKVTSSEWDDVQWIQIV